MIKKRAERLSLTFPGARSFYIIGDIAIITPKDVEVDYVKLAKKIIENHPRIKAVYLKKRVSGEYRTNELEFLYGEKKSDTIYKENGVKFYVNLLEVYVNPSLSRDRAKNLEMINNQKTILDAYTGYGAIALNIIHKMKVYVIAGDININGLYMLKKSLSLNKFKGMVDIVNYDANFLPFRDKAFEITFADNPTMVVYHKHELCRVSKDVVFYILTNSEEDARDKLGNTEWIKIKDYSKNLFIFKGLVRC
ncbi:MULTISPECIES: methyltransferase [unclassified Sulfolobus]|uniref:methyltransferase n=1 Tax=Sulfolobus sp. B1 TaxID=2200888 RepID=UPI000B29AF70|nr:MULTISPECIES: methyltransferase [unclassified Sulfolobus]